MSLFRRSTPGEPSFHNLTLFVIAAALFASLAVHLRQSLVMQLILVPGMPETQGAWWQLFSHLFIYAPVNDVRVLMGLLFDLLFFWYVGTALEREWGSGRHALFLAIAAAGSALAALALGWLGLAFVPLYGLGSVIFALTWEYGRRAPDDVIQFMFFLPVKAKYLVLVFAGFSLLMSNFQSWWILVAEALGAALAVGIMVLLDRRAAVMPATRSAERAEAAAATQDEKTGAANRALLAKARAGKDIPAPAADTLGLTPCPPVDFGDEDSYCQACDGYGYCLARARDAGVLGPKDAPIPVAPKRPRKK